MEINWDLLIKVLAVLPVLIPLILAAIREDPEDQKIERDVDLIAKLPDSAARAALLKRLDTRIREQDSAPARSRNIPSLAGAILGTLGLTWAAAALLSIGAWWAYLAIAPVVILLSVLVYGIFESSQKVPRDEKGKRLVT
ncbi:hypothetical protein [Oerskovia enterophila]|uniref:hypothetical protein n=1 Tax=Oerskovia enterophila TaxID=43678 RepID=UPI0038105A8B